MFKILTETPPTLKEAQAFVGGYIEMVTLPNGDQLLMDEDGGFKSHLKTNTEAVAHAAGSGVGSFGLNCLLGPVLCLQGEARWLS